MDHGHHAPAPASRIFLSSRAAIVLVGVLAIAGYVLVAGHWAHVIPFLPFALFLVCPMMHLFMHHGQGTPAAADGRGGVSPGGDQNASHQH